MFENFQFFPHLHLKFAKSDTGIMTRKNLFVKNINFMLISNHDCGTRSILALQGRVSRKSRSIPVLKGRMSWLSKKVGALKYQPPSGQNFKLTGSSKNSLDKKRPVEWKGTHFNSKASDIPYNFIWEITQIYANCILNKFRKNLLAHIHKNIGGNKIIFTL
jgi:hypothetical protein